MRYLLAAGFIFLQLLINAKSSAGFTVDTYQDKLKTKYQTIKQRDLDKGYIKPGDIYPIIDNLKSDSHFQVKHVGDSFLEKPIYKIKVGKGPVKLFMWSQMHGDEPTATASLFDLINYIKAPENKSWFDSWQDIITLHIVPMVNPDGAENDQRFNAQSIDINRDAKILQTPEGRLLNSLANEINPDFGFNLHDQNRFYSAGPSGKTATISLLAPAFNEAKDISNSRRRAMQLIGIINDNIQKQIPGHVGRYDDSYAFRAFGDLFSSMEIATILIESGHYTGDMTRQMARWLTFLSLVRSIDVIADQSYKNVALDKYTAIPMNDDNWLVDILLTNVNIDNKYTVDIAINYNRKFNKPKIKEIGDLSAKFGQTTRDMSGYKLHPIKGFKLIEAIILTDESYLKVLRQGYSYFIGEKSLIDNKTQFPIVIKPKKVMIERPQRRQTVNFIFSEQGQAKLAMIKGVWIDLQAH